TINREVIGIRALPVDAELPLVVEDGRRHDYPWRQHDQRLETSAIEWQGLDERAVDDGADRPRLRIHLRRTDFYGDGLAQPPNRQFEVNLDRILDVEDHIRLDELLEPGFFDLDAIAARGKIRQEVVARGVGRGLATGISVGSDDGHGGIDDHSFRGIGHAAGERGVRGLRAHSVVVGKKEENSEARSSAHNPISWRPYSVTDSGIPTKPQKCRARHPFRV